MLEELGNTRKCCGLAKWAQISVETRYGLSTDSIGVKTNDHLDKPMFSTN